MAPNARYTAVPSSIWATDSDFLELSARAQWLYIRLWTSDDRDAAGFVPFQPGLWAKSSTSTAAETIEAGTEELSAAGWVLVDFDAERAWLCRFIADDTFHSPNLYVSVMTKVRACPSWMLRDAAWKEIQRLGLPPVKSGKPEWRQEMERRLNRAFEALQAKMHANPEGLRKGSDPKGFRKGFERVSKLSNVKVNANAGADAHADATETRLCTGCGKEPSGGGPRGVWGVKCVAEGRAM